MSRKLRYTTKVGTGKENVLNVYKMEEEMHCEDRDVDKLLGKTGLPPAVKERKITVNNNCKCK